MKIELDGVVILEHYTCEQYALPNGLKKHLDRLTVRLHSGQVQLRLSCLTFPLAHPLESEIDTFQQLRFEIEVH